MYLVDGGSSTESLAALYCHVLELLATKRSCVYHFSFLR